ncbi:hypothetical protein A3C57_01215 [Candidatus Nomurabacteria bacterium RIFCSPHIGHO2_02_FULL_33_12]|nr:MAG: hypothetical protein A3C57_01215 [Candidatus Nomurabacteria bacterium RIFCSPHIGHO2_02_FULL_33_12]
MKKIIPFVIVVVVVVAGVYFIKSKKVDTNVPVVVYEQVVVEKYIRDNIKTLAPEDPVLGGSWYVVSVSVDSTAKSGEVLYEDGHIQGKANFTYTIIDGVVKIIILNPDVIPAPKSEGYLSGKITIGPFCPVEREGVPCPVPTEAYSSREVIIYLADKMTIKKKVKIDNNGNYKATLSLGNYFVQVSPAGIGDGEKKLVIIKQMQVSVVNFDIDTGIR